MDDFETAIAEYYRLGPERDRLSTWGYLEALRTADLLGRHLPPAPGVVYDIGGAEGAYALPLARDGYAVHLVDAWEPHVTAAAEASAAQPAAPLASCAVGDARDLSFEDSTADAVLLLGPLYHLLERADRLRALREAHRVLKPGGVLLAAAVSRYASTFDGVAVGDIGDEDFQGLVEGVLDDGLHRNTDPGEHPRWFTLTYFHRPSDLRDEVADAGFRAIELVAVESAAAWATDTRRLADPRHRDAVLKAIRRVESVPELLGASPHLMAIARKSH
ncbi:methyltransferase domain-containing protein [Saccharopolyspora sp. TS4A08]|uniref:Methyltransferase domain-containing protein n=1 Tax=Saccharopolyspora ipomoeae TaxID=3042027 RepID=A0ABT6PXH6_9PSEU|nr:class I SAM-dependent methyltransferase [Saccharopolyspora sp. TS4A08]MDI2032066.1 methyltransferase domain-containing protein [Saccharopolyspora sp. TS4A08]